jgi:hypothetical protein
MISNEDKRASIMQKQKADGMQLILPNVGLKSMITPIKNESNEPINNSLPLFMVSHIQNKKRTKSDTPTKNIIYVENSPLRKSHDMMLLSPEKRRRHV